MCKATHNVGESGYYFLSDYNFITICNKWEGGGYTHFVMQKYLEVIAIQLGTMTDDGGSLFHDFESNPTHIYLEVSHMYSVSMHTTAASEKELTTDTENLQLM